MTIQDIMTRDVITVPSSMTIAEVARTMRHSDVGSLPVVDDGKLVGVITDRDIVTRVVAEGRDPQVEQAQDYLTSDLVVAAPDWSIERASQIMAREQIRRLPVVDGGVLVGYIALADLAATDEDAQTGHTLQQISEPSNTQGPTAGREVGR